MNAIMSLSVSPWVLLFKTGLDKQLYSVLEGMQRWPIFWHSDMWHCDLQVSLFGHIPSYHGMNTAYGSQIDHAQMGQGHTRVKYLTESGQWARGGIR